MAASAKPLLYLHIGHPKSGSSTIQHFLETNQKALMADGLLVADRLVYFKDKPLQSGGSVIGITAIAEEDDPASVMRDRVKQGLGLLNQMGGRGLVLSAENLAKDDRPKIFQGLADLVDIHLIYYVRRRDDFIVSSWKQWQYKQGRPLHALLRAWTRSVRESYKDLLSQWLVIDGVKHVHVKPLHKSAFPKGSLLLDFCAQLKVDGAQLELVQDKNIAIDYDYSFLFSHTPNLFDGELHTNDLMNYLRHEAQDIIEDQGDEIIGLEWRQKLYDVYKEDYLWLHQNYFPDLDFEEIFGVPQGVESGSLYRPSPLTLAVKGFGLLMRLIWRQREDIANLHKRLQALERKNDSDA